MAYDDLPNIWCSMSTLNNRRVRQALEFEIGIPSTSRIIPHIFFWSWEMRSCDHCDPSTKHHRLRWLRVSSAQWGEWSGWQRTAYNKESGQVHWQVSFTEQCETRVIFSICPKRKHSTQYGAWFSSLSNCPGVIRCARKEIQWRIMQGRSQHPATCQYTKGNSVEICRANAIKWRHWAMVKRGLPVSRWPGRRYVSMFHS